MRRTFTLRKKIFGLLLSIALAILGAFVLLIQPMLLDSVDRIVERESRHQMEIVADSLLPLLLQNQFAGIHENLDQLRTRQRNWRRIELVGEGGRRLYPLGRLATSTLPDTERFVQEVRFRDTTLATLTVDIDFSEDRAKARQLALAAFLIIAAIVTVAMVLVALFLEFTVGRRARELGRAADRLANRDYAAILPAAGTDEIGDLVRSFGEMRDAVRSYDISLNDAREAAEAANHAKSDFLSMMGHELRTPLNGMLGMAQLLLMPNLTERERQDYARIILTSGQSLLTLLNDILDLSKIESGKLRIESAEFDPDDLIRETLALFSASATNKQLVLAGQWRASCGQHYRSDPQRLRQMLSKLIGNAIKFTAHGKIVVEGVEVARDADSAVLEFSVSDTGIGIPAEKLDLLFRPFSQADSSSTRKYGGSGLGLSIVRSLTERMGGDAGVDSVAGSGSRFWFRIRAGIGSAGDNADGVATPAPGEVRAVPVRAGSQARVLVVEDNMINQRVVEALLRKLGLSAALVQDGQQAVDAITRGHAADIVLMDVNMPVMDGCTATERIRRWEVDNSLPRRPIIALTANAFAEDRERCLRAGMDDYLAKPVTFATLQAVLGKWLRTAPELPPATSSAVHARQQVDREQFVGLVDTIAPLLVQNRFDAIDRFKDLQSLAAGSDLEAEIDEIDGILNAFDFDLALERLRRMVAIQLAKDPK
ncbi:ATP-binding protein [Accumulibacter sp.]|uniref:Virulence sensor protein BvgS n=1 Tax=Accumulibacter regalis TaxID=522306 RepID=C7RVM6_ACCRE|nr:ATP-binding protein [Accumulibacter sp.]MBO3716454.1 response regulator [Accumulibacter sp.]